MNQFIEYARALKALKPERLDEDLTPHAAMLLVFLSPCKIFKLWLRAVRFKYLR